MNKTKAQRPCLDSFLLLQLLILVVWMVTAVNGSQQQVISEVSFKSDIFEPKDTICSSPNKQYSGRVPISKGKKIFFWFFESNSQPKFDPILIWLSGGPGGASTFAALTEVGPCFVNISGNSTIENVYSWASHANLLIIDQPAGVGFSEASVNSSDHVKTLDQAADDFNEFLLNFFQDYFPQYASRPIHLASESYGGRWGPTFLDKIITLQRADSRRAIDNPIKSMILVNAVIGSLGGYLTSAKYEFGCTPYGTATKLGLGFNRTACAAIAEAGPSCEEFALLCERTNDAKLCSDSSNYCWSYITPWTKLDGLNPYNIAYPCIDADPLCLSGIKPVEKYLNLPWVQQELGVEKFNYTAINYDLEMDFEGTLSVTQSVMPLVINLLDNSDVRILFMNGNLDSLVVTPGQQRIVDNIRWKGQLEHRQQVFRDWFYTNETGHRILGGQVKGTDKLRFVSFENAGHMVPGDQPHAASIILKDWLMTL